MSWSVAHMMPALEDVDVANLPAYQLFGSSQKVAGSKACQHAISTSVLVHVMLIEGFFLMQLLDEQLCVPSASSVLAPSTVGGRQCSCRPAG